MQALADLSWIQPGGVNPSMYGLLDTKLYMPQSAPDLIPRQRLMARLDQGFNHKLTLICAPAGFGKTTLATTWLRSLDAKPSADDWAPTRVAWYSIDHADNDLTIFARYIMASLAHAQPLASPALDSLMAREGIPTPEQLATDLARVALTLPVRTVLALDDYHLITEQAIHRFMTHFVRHLPASLHLLIITRLDPPIGLSQLRARQQITEIRAHQLQFSVEETGVFLQATAGREVDPELAHILHDRTEGWVVGLRLIAISMHTHADQATVVQQFRQHSNRYIIDYLVDEVLASQPPDVQDFLLKTAILSRFCADLVASVVQIASPASHVILERLDKLNLFLIPLDEHRDWYRYHHQFQTMLLHRLRGHTSAAERAALHAQAAAWFAQHGWIDEALTHFLAADDPLAAAGLMERYLRELRDTEQWSRLAHWLALLPPEIVEQRPALLLARAWLLTTRFAYGLIPPIVARSERLLRLAPTAGETAETDDLWGQVHALHCGGRFEAISAEERIDHGRHALRLLSREDAWVRGYAYRQLGGLLAARGEWQTAVATIENELDQVDPQSTRYLARLHLALVYLHLYAGAVDHQLHSSRLLLENALRSHMLTSEQWGRLGLGLAHYARHEMDEAGAHLAAIFDHRDLAEFLTLVTAAPPLLDLYAARGDMEKGRRVVTDLRQGIQAGADAHSLSEVGAISAYWSLLEGDLATAARWAHSVATPSVIPDMSFRYHILVRIDLALGGPAERDQAQATLDTLIACYRQTHNIRLLISALVLQGLAYWAQQRTQAALACLTEAIDLGYPLGYRRVFVADGRPMSQMLNALARDHRYAHPVHVLLGALAGSSPARGAPRRAEGDRQELLIEPLTDREIEVLRLLATGLSNKEVAARLAISPLTVRNHTASIYGKLHVEGRRDAVARARLLGLLPSAG